MALDVPQMIPLICRSKFLGLKHESTNVRPLRQATEAYCLRVPRIRIRFPLSESATELLPWFIIFFPAFCDEDTMSWRRQLARLIPQASFVCSTALVVARRGAVVFMFHRVLEPGAVCYDAEMVTSTDLFGEFVQWLAREFEIVPLGEIAVRLQNGRPLKRVCSLTFDDGWVDNYTNAFSIIRRFNAPATIFLASSFIGSTRRLWQDRLWYLLRLISGTDLGDLVRNWRTQHQIEKAVPADLSFAAWRTFLMGVGNEEAEDFVVKLQDVVPRAAIPNAPVFMNWDQVREMHQAGIEFGAHTLNHVFLPNADVNTAQSEIEGSRREIEERMNGRIAGFAYPWGALNAKIRECVKRAGFKYAAGVQPGIVRSKSDMFLLPRMFMSDSVLRYGSSFSKTNTAVYLAVKSITRAGANEY